MTSDETENVVQQALDCPLFEEVCSLRREDGYCPLHPTLEKLQAQMQWLVDSGKITKEDLCEADFETKN